MATMNINWKPGQSIVYAGTPIDEDGNIANNSNAVALVASDTINPNAAEVITEGTWDEETNYHGITISDDCKRALPGIEFVGSDGEHHPATSLPTPKSDDAGKSAVVNEHGNAYALGAGGGGGGLPFVVLHSDYDEETGFKIYTNSSFADIVEALNTHKPCLFFFMGNEGHPTQVVFGVAEYYEDNEYYDEQKRNSIVMYWDYSASAGLIWHADGTVTDYSE